MFRAHVRTARHTHQAEQTADLINGAQAADEAHEHGESSDPDQDVAGDLYSCGVIWRRRGQMFQTHSHTRFVLNIFLTSSF